MKPLDAKKDMAENPSEYNGHTYDELLVWIGPDINRTLVSKTRMAEMLGVNKKKVYRMLDSVLKERGF